MQNIKKGIASTTVSYLILIFLSALGAQAQRQNVKAIPGNWWQLDWKTDSVPGISLVKAYNIILKDKKPVKKIVVAIIDIGLDDTHPDLAGMEWTNKKEIAGNGIDDDHNGYKDDIHGWNFAGNVFHENYEPIREYIRLHGAYENIRDTTKSSDNPDIIYWRKVLFEEEKIIKQNSFYPTIRRSMEIIQAYWSKMLKKDTLYVWQIKDLQPQNADSSVIKAQTVCQSAFKSRKRLDSMTLNSVLENLSEFIEINITPIQNNIDTAMKYNAADYFRRTELHDDPYSNTIKDYGDNNVLPREGESHGTECAGLIAALRENGIGIDGITNSVEIMPIRIFAHQCDEWDKDIANAIAYAVNNGAKIISMSIGKYLSPQKKWVDNAIRYAEDKGILFISAAGNDATDNDVRTEYPEVLYLNKTQATNMIKVGASTFDSSLVATFSCFGKKTVDVFAPGVNIYTTTLHGAYTTVEGTSYSAPIVAGVAALVWSYYPKLSFRQIKYCIEKSAVPINLLVKKPGTDETIPFSELSKTGGIINVYTALLLAAELNKNNY